LISFAADAPKSFTYVHSDTPPRMISIVLQSNGSPLVDARSTQPSTLRGMVQWVPANGRWCYASVPAA